MSQSPAIFNMPHSMKKKIITALVAVVIGHVGALWAVSHMKPIKLKPIEKEPLKVKFVKIQEPPKPELPKPKEKPKPEPKKEVKEVKIVEKQLPPPPKKIEKVQQVKTEVPKQVVQKVSDKSQQVSEVPKAQPAADPSPKQVSIGGSGAQWSRSPKISSVTASELNNKACSALVAIDADEKGRVTNVRFIRSTCPVAIEQKILRAVKNAKFKPYMENGIAYPIIGPQQPFEFNP